MQKTQKVYNTPTLKDWGKVADMTKTGCTNPGGDAMNGSVMSQGRPPVTCKTF